MLPGSMQRRFGCHTGPETSIGLNLDFEPLYQLQCCPLPRLILLDSPPQQATRHGSKAGGRPVKPICKDEIFINNFINTGNC